MKTNLNALTICCIGLLMFLVAACQNHSGHTATADDTSVCIPLLDVGPDPYALLYEGKYYYTQNCEDKIILWETDDLTRLKEARQQTVWTPADRENLFHLWAPELHRIDGKWYLYYSADDGHTDNQQIYVLENEAASPMEGEFRMKGCIQTHAESNWSIQANVFCHHGRWYIVWCGKPDASTDRILQNIYLAELENPWTLRSERVLLSQPEYEWERQWICPDGNKIDRPAFINEAPQFFRFPGSRTLCLFFSASGSWTPYYCVGLLTADADSDLLDPASWHKQPEPMLMQHPEEDVYGPGSVSFVSSPSGEEWYVLYHARSIPNDASGAIDTRRPHLQRITPGTDGIPVIAPPRRRPEDKKETGNTKSSR